MYNRNNGYGLYEMIRAHVNLPVMGKVLLVMPSTDANYQRYAEIVKTDPEGNVRLFTTISAAYDAATTNANDVIALSANAAHAQTSMLTITKNRIHFIGMSGRIGRNGAIGLGSRARITMGDSTVAADIAVMKNTGVGNTFTGIKFDSSSTVAASLYAVAEGGEYTIYDNCEFYKSTDLDETAAAEVANNGDSVQWLNCYFGDTVNTRADNVIRPNMIVTPEIITGKLLRDNYIANSVFAVKAGGTETKCIYGVGANAINRMLIIKNTIFFNNPLSAAAPATAIGFDTAQTDGAVLCDVNCTMVDITAMGTTGQAVYLAAPSSPTYASSGEAVAS